MENDFDKDLEGYFTGVEQIRNAFKDTVLSPTLGKRIFVIWGDGGVGKTSLLRMFRLYSKSIQIPFALVSSDEVKSDIDLILRWVEDLKAGGIKFPFFDDIYKEYNGIQAKVAKQAKKFKGADVISKLGETTGGALAGALLGSIIPGAGTVIGGIIGTLLGSMGADACVEWMGGFLNKNEVDLVKDPTKALTNCFIKDLSKNASEKRIVLALDTYEKMTINNEWVLNVAKILHNNILLVISGHAIPDWDRSWSEFIGKSQIYELTTMNDENIRELIHRYTEKMGVGELDSDLENKIIQFSHGLPLFITTAVQLIIRYGFQDFASVKTDLYANIVDRLVEGVPHDLIPVLEAAAAVRWFNEPILQEVLGLDDVRDVFDELRRFPFVHISNVLWGNEKKRMLHDVFREIIDENLRIRNPKRHSELHRRAALYFETKLAEGEDDEIEKLGLERLYHRILENEKSGIKLFQEMSEELIRNQFIGHLRTLLNDVNSYPLNNPNSNLWREYYNARLLHVSFRFSEAEEIYKNVVSNNHAESKLKAYSLCDASQIWTRNYRLIEDGGLERAFNAIEKSLRLAPEMDSKLALNYSYQRYAYLFNGESDNAINALNKQHDVNKDIGDKRGVVYSLDQLKDLYGILGNWEMASRAEKEGLAVLDSMPPNSFLRTRIIGHNIWHKIWGGKLSEAESGIIEAIDFANQQDYIEAFPGLYRDLGLVYGLQKRWQQSHDYFSRSVAKYNEHERFEMSSGLGTVFGFWGFISALQGEFDKSENYLIRSLTNKKRLQNHDCQENLVWLGRLYELKAKKSQDLKKSEYLSQAESYYLKALEESKWISRKYFECSAIIGLISVRYSCNIYKDIVDYFTQAEYIANKYCYNDILATLNLYKGHIQWSGFVNEWENGFSTALQSYYLALLYALNYNRYLLDTVLWGETGSTYMFDIISKCKQEGNNGQAMLKTLAELWEGKLDSLLANKTEDKCISIKGWTNLSGDERIARLQEPGDRAPQTSVKEILGHNLQ